MLTGIAANDGIKYKWLLPLLNQKKNYGTFNSYDETWDGHRVDISLMPMLKL